MTSQPSPSSRLGTQARLDLGDQLAEGGVGERPRLAIGNREGRHVRLAIDEVEGHARQRDEDGGGDGERRAVLRHPRGDAGRALGRGGTGKQAARDLDAGCVGLGGLDQAAGPLGLDLGELIAIDLERTGAGIVRARRRPRQRSQHGDQHADVISAKMTQRSMSRSALLPEGSHPAIGLRLRRGKAAR